MLRRMRRRAKAKIRAIPARALDSSPGGLRPDTTGVKDRWRAQVGFGGGSRSSGSSSDCRDVAGVVDSGGEGRGGHRRQRKGWDVGAVGSAVLGTPVRFVRRKVGACKSFVTSRERIHWASLAMAAYIFTTSVVPRLPAGMSPEASTGGSTAGADKTHGASYEDHEFHPSLRSSGFRPYDDRRSRPGRRRNNYYSGTGGHGGSIDTTITHLDDHAEQLWLNSPAIRAAASAAAAAAAEAAEESLGTPATAALPGDTTGQQANPTPTDDGSLSSGLTSNPEHRADALEGGEVRGALVGGTNTDEQGAGLSADDEFLGRESADGPADLGPPTLRTHTDLGDLELAAEKALDLLRDEGADVVEEGSGDLDGGDGGRIGGGGTSTGEGRGSDGVDGMEKVSPSSDVPTGQEGSNGARVSAISRGVPPSGDNSGAAVRLRTGSSTENSNTAALPVRGLRVPGRGARGRAGGKQQQEQVERQATAGPAKTAAEGEEKEQEKEKVKAKSSKATTDGEGNTSPMTPEVSLASPSPDSGAAPLPSDEGRGGSGSASRRRHSTSFVAVAARAVSPAVCRIDMERLVGTHGAPFGDVETGQGSGLIFSSEDGLVLTNAHVVAGARKVTCTLTDGRKFLAEVKGSDTLSDLAVLQIDRDVGSDQTPLPEVTLGDSQDLQVGDWVIAVGNPVGLDSTVTLGIVSSMKRSSEEVGFLSDRKVNFIQTDAAINPGNSGGPLVNEFGEVVGVNTAVRANTEGIGFAIPINKAKAIMYELAQGNRIEYAYLGITMTTITPDYALQNNLDPNSHQLIPEVNGAIIMKVLPNTPAADAGLRRHDVVIEMRGRPVRTADEAKQVVDESSVGDIITLKVMRGVDRVVEIQVRARDVAEQLNGSEGGGAGSGGTPSGPRPQPRPYPGAPPPAFPWGGGGGGLEGDAIPPSQQQRQPQKPTMGDGFDDSTPSPPSKDCASSGTEEEKRREDTPGQGAGTSPLTSSEMGGVEIRAADPARAIDEKSRGARPPAAVTAAVAAADRPTGW
eukprot:g6162.t1